MILRSKEDRIRASEISKKYQLPSGHWIKMKANTNQLCMAWKKPSEELSQFLDERMYLFDVKKKKMGVLMNMYHHCPQKKEELG